MANLAYALLLATGLAMVLMRGLSLATFWIARALVLCAALLALGLGLAPIPGAAARPCSWRWRSWS